MKFILDESMTLEEKRLVEEPKGSEVYKELEKYSNTPYTDKDDVLLYNAIKNAGYSSATAEATVKKIKQDEASGRHSERDDWILKYGEKSAPQEQQNTETETATQQQNTQQNDTSNTQEETSDEEQSDNIATVNGPTNSDVANKLLKVVKSSNSSGYESFLNGIKSNIKDNNFPFTKLISNQKFSNALIGIKESIELTEGPLLNAGKRFIKKISPNTFKRFATVYNAFLDNDKDIRATDYVNKSKILYMPELYKLPDLKDIERAIDIELSALKSGDTVVASKRLDDLEKAVKNNTVKKVSSMSGGTSQRSGQSNKEILQKAVEILKANPEAKAAFQKEVNK